MVYNLSAYLDIIHDHWDGYVYEVSNSYSAVMPLLVTQKAGFKILKNPILAQQLGLTCVPGCNVRNLVHELIGKLTSSYQIIEYPFNHQNLASVQERDQESDFVTGTTQILDLNRDYSDIQSQYRRDRKARLKQASKNDLTIYSTDDSEILLHLFSENVEAKIPGGVDKITLDKIRRLINNGLSTGIGQLFTITDIDQKALSGGYFTSFKNRLTYLFGATSDKGKRLQANSYLLDHIIQMNCGKECILDFEGSAIESIEDFYKSFGTQDEKFYSLNYQTPVFQTMLNTRKKIHQFLSR